MAMIFRQPGKTGIENLNKNAVDSLTACQRVHVKKGENIKSKAMKLNSIRFCLCVGLCSSALINNAFSMNEHGKIDKYSAMIVSKYLPSKQDCMTLEMVNKKFEGNFDKFHFNPLSINRRQLKLFPNIETLHLYTMEDVNNFLDYMPVNDLPDGNLSDNDGKFHQVKIYAPISYEQAKELLPSMQELLFEYDEIDENDNIVRMYRKDNPGRVQFMNVYIKNVREFGDNSDETEIGNVNHQTGEFLFNDSFYRDNNNKWTYRIREMEERFNGDRRIKSIKIPNGTKSIGYALFGHCYELQHVEIPDSVTKIDVAAFVACSNLKNIILPVNIGSIESYAFQLCYNLENIVLPANLASIGAFAFQRCAFKAVTLPENLKSIGGWAFFRCYQLESIDIPDSVIEIERCVFFECTAIKSINVQSERVKQLVINSESGIDPNIIHVVNESIE